jgi:ABC-type microcin C transport system permease subunit YejE
MLRAERISVLFSSLLLLLTKPIARTWGSISCNLGYYTTEVLLLLTRTRRRRRRR